MIKYTVTCSEGHTIEGWYESASYFDEMKSAGKLTCEWPGCGSRDINKALMAPAVNTSSDKSILGDRVASPLAELRRQIEAKNANVGDEFVGRVRNGENNIYGNATLDEARQLVREGHQIRSWPFSKLNS